MPQRRRTPGKRTNGNNRSNDNRRNKRYSDHSDDSDDSEDNDDYVVLGDDKYSENMKKRNSKNNRNNNNNVFVAGFENDNSIDSPNMNYHEMDMQQLQKRREEGMQDQEAALDAIHQGVIGLKNHAIAINDEVVDQNAILDDLGQNMDEAQVDLEKQTEKAKKINKKKTKVCKLYCVIIFLIIVLTVIIALPSSSSSSTTKK